MFKKKIIWKKLGLLIKPQKKNWFTRSHCMVPTPEYLDNNSYRIYYSGRNLKNQSIITYADLIFNLNKIKVKYSKKPIFEIGKLGTFDDNGVTPSCVLQLNKKIKSMYYIGWNPGSTTRMNLYGGLAFFNKNVLKRYSEAPLLERSITDPYLNTAPWVIRIKKNLFYMYYVSGTKWKNKDLPFYRIKFASSTDGINWKRDGRVCIDFKNKSECALARPYVIKEGRVFKMWFSYKSKNTSYKIGYAESYDGLKWVRNDNFNSISTSRKGFDSDMVGYPVIIKIKNLYYMLYNGNNYGYEGIGIAVGRIV